MHIVIELKKLSNSLFRHFRRNVYRERSDFQVSMCICMSVYLFRNNCGKKHRSFLKLFELFLRDSRNQPLDSGLICFIGSKKKSYFISDQFTRTRSPRILLPEIVINATVLESYISSIFVKSYTLISFYKYCKKIRTWILDIM